MGRIAHDSTSCTSGVGGLDLISCSSRSSYACLVVMVSLVCIVVVGDRFRLEVLGAGRSLHSSVRIVHHCRIRIGCFHHGECSLVGVGVDIFKSHCAVSIRDWDCRRRRKKNKKRE